MTVTLVQLERVFRSPEYQAMLAKARADLRDPKVNGADQLLKFVTDQLLKFVTEKGEK